MLWNQRKEDQVARKCHHKYNKVRCSRSGNRQLGHGLKRCNGQSSNTTTRDKQTKARPAREDPWAGSTGCLKCGAEGWADGEQPAWRGQRTMQETAELSGPDLDGGEKSSSNSIYARARLCVWDYLWEYASIHSFIYSKAPNKGLNLGHGSESAKS